MRVFIRIAAMMALAVAAVLVPASAALADVSMTTSLSWPSGAGVGATNLAGSFTAQNLNTPPQQDESLTVTTMRVAPSCGAVRSGSTVCPTPDAGNYQLSSIATGAAGTACAGITFTVSAPDASGVVSFTPSASVVLHPPGGAAGSDRCTVNVVIAVTKVPSIDVDPAAGIQTFTNLFVQATSMPSGLSPAVGLSLETTVNRGIPGLSTAASVVTPGNVVADTATLTAAGSGPTPGGTVTFSVFGPNDSSCSGTAQMSSKTISSGSATATFPAATAGVYRFTASYSGDSNYSARLAQCNDPGESVMAGGGVAPPTITKAFGAASIPLTQSTTLSFTLSNPNTGTALTGVGFSDTMPAGLVVTSPNGLHGSCGGGTITAAAGSSTLSLSGAVLAGNGSCAFSVRVTGTTAGQKNNSTSSVTSSEGGSGGGATATVVVVPPPTITQTFGPRSIAVGGTSTLTFTLSNPTGNTVALSGVAFADSLPAGLVVASPNGFSGACGGGTIVAAAGSGTIGLSGATLPATTSCTFSVKVTGTTVGKKKNKVTATSANGGSSAKSSATLTVIAS